MLIDTEVLLLGQISAAADAALVCDGQVRIVADAGPPVAVFDDATIQERL